MLRMMIPLIAAGGFLLLDAPQAAAHQEVRNLHLPAPYYHVDHRRMDRMPRWLKRNKPFVRWYRHSEFRHDRRLSWNELFRIYHWRRAGVARYYPWASIHRRHSHRHLHSDGYRIPRAVRHPHRH